MFNESFYIFIETFAAVSGILYAAWAIYSFIIYLHDLPEKRKTCKELYIIRSKKENEVWQEKEHM